MVVRCRGHCGPGLRLLYDRLIHYFDIAIILYGVFDCKLVISPGNFLAFWSAYRYWCRFCFFLRQRNKRIVGQIKKVTLQLNFTILCFNLVRILLASVARFPVTD